MISANKANRLYWLGRYTERAYISLHLLRRYYDKMIDGRADEYKEYYRKLNVENPYPDEKAFQMGYMYDDKNPVSLLSGLTAANDNAIVLREEITSETLSYIQLSLCHIQAASKKGDSNITDLQPITDYLLAFWGSIDERVFDEQVRRFLKAGKLVENIDMHIRFDYPFRRIKEAYDCLKQCIEGEESLADKTIMGRLDELLNEDLYHHPLGDYKTIVLKFVNHLILV